MFVVRHEIFRSVFLNRFVMNVASLPMYVNDAHLCVVVFISLLGVVVGCLWLVGGGLCVRMGKPLLDRRPSSLPTSYTHNGDDTP